MVLSALLFAAAAAVQRVSAQAPGTFDIVGTSGVSAQQLFHGAEGRVYILDKVQNNALQVNGHPAWAVEYNTETNQIRAMDVVTNSFCAGGAVSGNGTWLNVGGNQAVIPGGGSTTPDNATNPYKDGDGGQDVRTLLPCTDNSCNWGSQPMTTRRWYPMLETYNDGSVIILGGNLYGGFVNNPGNNNPTWEWWPSRGPVQRLNFLMTTLPANLFPLTWLLPSGRLFIQTNLGAELFNPLTGFEDALPNVPHAVRTYPASAATAMLPLTPANNWTATVLFCGGSDLQPDQWTAGLDLSAVPASASCVYMSPDVDRTWHEDDDLPDGRTMGNFIMLPDATLFLCNGANMGVAGYGVQPWTKGDSFADSPLLLPLIYDPSRPAGQKFSSDGLSESTVPRMYHSTATLLSDGSVFIAGSSPHPDVITTNTLYPTEYRVEKFYPWYYNKPRPQPLGLPSRLGYGGSYFEVKLSDADLNSDGASALEETKVVLIRTGFATHAMNFGQRFVQLDNSYTLNDDGSATLHVSQLPPNPSILAPGPAILFVVVNGVPSHGKFIMVGSGVIGTQPVAAAQALPDKVYPEGGSPGSGNYVAGGKKKGGDDENAAGPRIAGASGLAATVALGVMAAML